MDTTQKSLAGTKTASYLAQAYIAESTAVTRYTYYSQQAKKDNYFQYANVIQETPDNALPHEKIFLKSLPDGGLCSVPVGIDSRDLSNTVNYLENVAQEVQNEGVNVYTTASKVANE